MPCHSITRRLSAISRCALLIAVAGVPIASPADSHGGSLLGNIFRQPGTTTTVTGGGPTIDQARRAAYNGPKARVAVARFTDKTGSGWYSGSLGQGMSDQLTTALFQTNRFIVLERETIRDVLQEQDLARSGRISAATGAPTGQIEGAELLITGAVTEFERNSGGGSGGIAGGLFGDAGKVIGKLARGYRTAHLAIDLRVIDARTSRILAATTVQGEASDVNMGAALLGATGGARLGGQLSGWKNTPIEKALRQTINEAVNFVVSQTPRNFYRHGQQQIATSAPSQRRVTSAPRPTPTPVQPRRVPNYQGGEVARTSSSRLNVRSGPGTSHPVMFSVTRNDPMLVLGRSGDWIQVKDSQQRTGWTAGWLTYVDSNADASQFAAPATEVAAPSTAASTPEAKPAVQTPPTSAPGQDVATRLKRLDNLRAQGVISDEEHATLRQKILSEL